MKFVERGCIAVRMSRPTAEAVTSSSKTQVTVCGNVGKHWLQSGMSHRVVWYFGRPANVSEESTTSIFRIASALKIEAEYYFETPVSACKCPRFQDEWTPSWALSPSIWGRCVPSQRRETLTQRRWGNVSWGLSYRDVLSCWWICELSSSQWTQYQHQLLYAELDTNRLNAVAGKLMGEKGHTSPAQRTAVPPCSWCSVSTL